jgi:hypothetical protein
VVDAPDLRLDVEQADRDAGPEDRRDLDAVGRREQLTRREVNALRRLER